MPLGPLSVRRGGPSPAQVVEMCTVVGMVDLRPFRALRPLAHAAARVGAPPYDVVDRAAAAAQADTNPDSILWVTRPEIRLPDDYPADSDPAHEAARTALDDLVDRGVLVLDEVPTYSVYRQRTASHVQTGLVALASAADYTSGRMRTHEQTRPDKELDRARHIRALGAHDEPVFLLTAPGEQAWGPIGARLERLASGPPAIDLTVGEVRHQVWPVADPAEVDRLRALTAALPETYIADGHHRSAAAAAVARQELAADAFPVVLFGGDDLRILPYNRVVTDLAGRTPEEFLSALAGAGPLHPLPGPIGPRSRGEVTVHLADQWHRLTLPPATSDDPVAALDVSLLQDVVLGPLLGIADPRTDRRIGFAGGSRSSEELAARVRSGQAAAAFWMYPTSVDDLVSVASTGRDLPPKSTWFEPKLLSGLFLNRFAETAAVPAPK